MAEIFKGRNNVHDKLFQEPFFNEKTGLRDQTCLLKVYYSVYCILCYNVNYDVYTIL